MRWRSFITDGAAMAGPTVSPGVVNPGINPGVLITIPDCATGFTKGAVNGSPTTSPYSWTCTTPEIICPAAPSGMQGGIGSWKAEAYKKGVRFSYVCSYMKPIP